MNKVSFFTIIFLALFSDQALAQYQASWLTDNYAGVNALNLNPALPGNFPLRWDLNLASAEFFLTNNYGYVEDASVLSLYRKRESLDIRFGPDLEELVEEIDFLFEFYEGDKKRYGNVQTNIMGPSLSFKINDNHQVGLFTGAHVLFGTRKTPRNLSYYEYNSKPYFKSFKMTPVAASAVSYSEIGVNYIYKNSDNEYSDFTFGINLKRLQGWEAAYLRLEETIDFTKIAEDTIQSGTVPVTFGYTKSLAESAPDPEFNINGTGFGVDLGFVYTKNSDDPYKIYDYKLGASLMNLGFLKFDENTEDHEIDSANPIQLAWNDYKNYSGLESLDDAVRQFSYQALQDSSASMTSDNFRVNLPATLNLQADFSIIPYIFVGANLIQPIYFGKVQPATVSHFSVTPRFESRWLGGYLPVSVTNWNEVNLGLAMRLGYLTIGTENIKSLFVKSRLNSTEIFAAVKFNPFNLGFSNKKGRSLKGIKCYDF